MQGGRPIDEQIEVAIREHDDPDHPGSLTVDDVNELINVIERAVHSAWSEWMESVEVDEARVVGDTFNVVVLSTRDEEVYHDILDRFASHHADVKYDNIAHRVVSTTIHNWAKRLSNHDWSDEYPLVVSKPDGARDGEAYTTAVINNLLRRGLSPGQAWAYYGVEIVGDSRNTWASRCGYSDHSAVSEPLRKAHEKLDQ
jgi:hypothetical protein